MDDFREEFPGRAEMIAYAEKHKIPVQASAKKPYSMDRNLLHISFEAGMLEDVWFDSTAKNCRDMYKLSVAPEDATYFGYWDADLATPLDAVAGFVEILDRDPRIDVVIGARVALLGRDIQRRLLRHYVGRVFATAASVVLRLPVFDTQCGAKLFRCNADMRGLFERPFGSRWIFDVEVLARYLARPSASSQGLYELPLARWVDVGESRLKLRDFVHAAADLATIYRQYRPGRRGQDEGRRTVTSR